jgi:hypothetical protein
MNWSDVASAAGKFAPVLGTLLGGPAGAAVGGLVAAALGVENSPNAVNVALATDPQAAVKLQELQSNERIKLNELLVAAESNRLAAETAASRDVNQTMQAEAQSSHWPTYTWRPVLGFAVAFNTVASSVLVLGVFGAIICGSAAAGAAIASLPMVLGALAAINGTVLPVLGIASYFRGKAQADPMNPMPVKG